MGTKATTGAGAPGPREAVEGRRGLAAALFSRLLDVSADPPGVTRDSYGQGENRAHEVIGAAAAELGLELSRDAAANLYMTLPGRDRRRPRVIVGSHLDSVPHGGNFDGAAGVIAGLLAAAALKDLGRTPPQDLTVMAIRAEESAWFRVSYLGSRAALGTLPEGALGARRVDTGRTLAEHIAECGGDPEALRRGERRLEPADLRAYLEVHIEQAPSLVDAGLPVAICTGIPGNFRYPEATIVGEQAHVGLPRRFRRDAAMAACDMACALDRKWEELEAAGHSMAFTLGRFHTDARSHSMTVVPGRFEFSLDVRAHDPEQLEVLERHFHASIAEVEARRGVRFELGRRASAAVGRMCPALQEQLGAVALAVGVPTMALGSPGSHDAAAFAAAGVPTGMLLLRNENGSHNPAEAMELDDLLAAAAILIGWLTELG